MLTVFAVQIIDEASQVSKFVIVGAPDVSEAVATVAQQALDDGMPDAIVVGVFTLDEIHSLAAQMEEANASLPESN